MLVFTQYVSIYLDGRKDRVKSQNRSVRIAGVSAEVQIGAS
jgi:hypothetical protein